MLQIANFLSFGSIDAFLAFILIVTLGINAMLTKLLLSLQDVVRWILGLSLTTNLPVLRTIWTLLRDFCNMGFFLIFIGIAFAYILNVFPKLKSYAKSSLIINVLVAALLINFSFAIGQTIVFFGNTLTKIALNILPKEDLTTIIVQAMAPVSFAAGNPINTSGSGVATAKEGAFQEYVATATAQENLRYQACVKEVDPTRALSLKESIANSLSGGTIQAVNYFFRDSESCAQEILAARRGAGQQGWVATLKEIAGNLSANSTDLLLSLFAGEALKVFITLSLLLCFGSMAIFLFIRILAIWILLATAPLYWFSIAIPGGNQVGTWINQVRGWSLFAPVYFLLLTPGLLFMQSRGEVVASIAQGGANWPYTSVALQSIVFYVFVVVVFGIVTAMSKKIAFAKLSGPLADVAGKAVLTMDGAMNAVYGKALKGTVDGAKAAVSKRATQAWEDRVQSFGNRWKFKSSQEVENKIGRIIGVRGADKKEAGDAPGRITKRQKQIEQDMESALAQVTDPKKKKELEEQQITTLRTKLSSEDKYEALAAGEVLLKKKKASVAELKAMRKTYTDFSVVAGTTFQERMHKALVSDFAKKEYKDTKDADGNVTATGDFTARQEYRQILEMMVENNDAKGAGEFYSTIKKGKNKLAAIRAAISAKKPDGKDAELVKDKKGKVINELYEALSLESGLFGGKDWKQIEAQMFTDATTKGTEKGYQDLQKTFEEFLSTGAKAGSVVGYIDNKEQLARVTDKINEVKEDLKLSEKERRKYDKAMNKASIQAEDSQPEKGKQKEQPEPAKKEDDSDKDKKEEKK